MPTLGATLEQKNGVLELTKIEYHKSGISLYISETVFRAQIFQILMLMGHFAPQIEVQIVAHWYKTLFKSTDLHPQATLG